MAPKTKVSSAEETIKVMRRETRRKWNAEEKIRIVLEGLRGEMSSFIGLRRGTIGCAPCSTTQFCWLPA